MLNSIVISTSRSGVEQGGLAWCEDKQYMFTMFSTWLHGTQSNTNVDLSNEAEPLKHPRAVGNGVGGYKFVHARKVTSKCISSAGLPGEPPLPQLIAVHSCVTSGLSRKS